MIANDNPSMDELQDQAAETMFRFFQNDIEDEGLKSWLKMATYAFFRGQECPSYNG